jgi:DNA-binding NarL/FixJ family response regulator
VLECAARGMLPNEIGARLGLPVSVVHARTRRAMQSLGAHSKLEAIVIALRSQLIDLQRVHDSPRRRYSP